MVSIVVANRIWLGLGDDIEMDFSQKTPAEKSAGVFHLSFYALYYCI
jgi:hypothetical protein